MQNLVLQQIWFFDRNTRGISFVIADHVSICGDLSPSQVLLSREKLGVVGESVVMQEYWLNIFTQTIGEAKI